MKREREGEPGTSYVESFERVCDFISKLDGEKPNADQVAQIQTDLEVVTKKFRRIRALYPKYRIEMSEKIWTLLELCGLAARSPNGSFKLNE